jgi:hypothetical protein
MLARTDVRMLLACLLFAAWFTALLFGVLGPAAHLFLAAALVAWPWRAIAAVARGEDPPHEAQAGEPRPPRQGAP